LNSSNAFVCFLLGLAQKKNNLTKSLKKINPHESLFVEKYTKADQNVKEQKFKFIRVDLQQVIYFL
jgi:hypothetical protein